MNSSGILDPSQWTGQQQASQQNQQQLKLMQIPQLRKSDGVKLEENGSSKPCYNRTELANLPKQQENQKQQSPITQTPLELLKKRFGPQKIIASSHNQIHPNISIKNQDGPNRNVYNPNPNQYVPAKNTNVNIHGFQAKPAHLQVPVHAKSDAFTSENKDTSKKDVSHREISRDELDRNNLLASNAQVVSNHNQTLISNTNSCFVNNHGDMRSNSAITSYSTNQNTNPNNKPIVNNVTDADLKQPLVANKVQPTNNMSIIITNNNGVISYQSGLVANLDMIQSLSGQLQQTNKPNGSKQQANNDMPDLRQQFLQMQNLPAPGQMVILPPLSEDRSIQILQLLTPLNTGGFNTQTIVLPITKVGGPPPQNDPSAMSQIIQNSNQFQSSQNNTPIMSQIIQNPNQLQPSQNNTQAMSQMIKNSNQPPQNNTPIMSQTIQNSNQPSQNNNPIMSPMVQNPNQLQPPQNNTPIMSPITQNPNQPHTPQNNTPIMSQMIQNPNQLQPSQNNTQAMSQMIKNSNQPPQINTPIMSQMIKNLNQPHTPQNNTPIMSQMIQNPNQIQSPQYNPPIMSPITQNPNQPQSQQNNTPIMGPIIHNSNQLQSPQNNTLAMSQMVQNTNQFESPRNITQARSQMIQLQPQQNNTPVNSPKIQNSPQVQSFPPNNQSTIQIIPNETFQQSGLVLQQSNILNPNQNQLMFNMNSQMPIQGPNSLPNTNINNVGGIIVQPQGQPRFFTPPNQNVPFVIQANGIPTQLQSGSFINTQYPNIIIQNPNSNGPFIQPSFVQQNLQPVMSQAGNGPTQAMPIVLSSHQYLPQQTFITNSVQPGVNGISIPVSNAVPETLQVASNQCQAPEGNAIVPGLQVVNSPNIVPSGPILQTAPGCVPVVPVIGYPHIAPTTQNSVVVKSDDDELLLNQIDETGLPRIMQGIDLDRLKQFASEFKEARQKIGLTQTQVGQNLQAMYGDKIVVSQSTICRFEKLEITAQQVKKLLPALQSWLDQVRAALNKGAPVDMEAILNMAKEPIEIKPRKKRTIFGESIVAQLNEEFKAYPAPGQAKLAEISEKVGLDKETVRIWFGNRRQTEKKAKKEKLQ